MAGLAISVAYRSAPPKHYVIVEPMTVLQSSAANNRKILNLLVVNIEKHQKPKNLVSGVGKPSYVICVAYLSNRYEIHFLTNEIIVFKNMMAINQSRFAGLTADFTLMKFQFFKWVALYTILIKGLVPELLLALR